MKGQILEKSMTHSRQNGKTELVFFVNAGDPSLEVTYQMLKVLARQGLVAVELCVPFPKSLTDGPLIRASHERALSNGVDLDGVLALTQKAREELDLAIVILADYSHTVKPIGIERFLERCLEAGAAATLIHCLPPLLRKAYVRHSEQLGLGRIMSFFIGSDPDTRAAAYRETQGFIYLVSRFGRTGNRVDFDAEMLGQLRAIRAETDKPLAVGFGVKTRDDVAALRAGGADAVIIGSAATAIVEQNLAAPAQIPGEFEKLVRDFASACTAVKQSPAEPAITAES